MSRAKSSIGQALQLHGDAVEAVEALYEQQSGEVTAATELAEQAADLAAEDALEQLARFHRWTGDQLEAAGVELARVQTFQDGMRSRQEWAEERMAGLVRAQDRAAKSKRAGTLMVRLRDHYSVQAAPNLDLDRLPPSWLREVAGKPAVAASVALDKTRAKKALRAGWRTGEPPGPGWYGIDQPLAHCTVVYLWKGLISAMWNYCTKLDDTGRPVGGVCLDAIGLSFAAKPRFDQLRWRHHAPGVELVRRVAVTVV